MPDRPSLVESHARLPRRQIETVDDDLAVLVLPARRLLRLLLIVGAGGGGGANVFVVLSLVCGQSTTFGCSVALIGTLENFRLGSGLSSSLSAFSWRFFLTWMMARSALSRVNKYFTFRNIVSS